MRSLATIRAIVLVLIAVLLLGACGDTLQAETGVVLTVESQGLSHIDGFTLRTSDGRELHFDTTQTRFAEAGFPPQHLQEHRALAEPVRVTYQIQDGVNRVVKLEDAAR